MQSNREILEAVQARAAELGVSRAACIPANRIETNEGFRALCQSNQCGMYGKCWMCPPDIGDITSLTQRVKSFEHALVYQLITPLEDSFDIEGMREAKRRHQRLTQKLRQVFDGIPTRDRLHLGAGGCGVCRTCTRSENKPCRYPEHAVSSLEAYGIDVSRLAAAAGMRYVNGANTVTYFGVVLFSL